MLCLESCQTYKEGGEAWQHLKSPSVPSSSKVGACGVMVARMSEQDLEDVLGVLEVLVSASPTVVGFVEAVEAVVARFPAARSYLVQINVLQLLGPSLRFIQDPVVRSALRIVKEVVAADGLKGFIKRQAMETDLVKVLGRCLERDLAEARDALLELSKVCRSLVCADPGVVKLLVDRVRDDPLVVSVLAELLVDSGAARQLVEGGGVPAIVLCYLETGDGCCVECLEKICEDGHGRAVADAGGIEVLTKCLDETRSGAKDPQAARVHAVAAVECLVDSDEGAAERVFLRMAEAGETVMVQPR